MEKLTCPECGSEVLPEAKVCENCGCKITVCPDCGATYKVGQVRCASCGRVLDEEKLYRQAEEDIKKIEERIDADEKREKKIGKFEWAGIILGLLCMGIAFGVHFLWKNQNDVDALLSMQSRKNLCMAFAILGVIFSTLSGWVVDVFKEFVSLNSLITWLRDTIFDYREYIRLHGQAETIDTYDSILYSYKLSQAAMQIESNKTKIAINVFYVFSLLVSLALDISFGVFACNLIPQLFASRFISIEIEWLTPALYSGFVFLLLWFGKGVFNQFIYPRMIKKKKKEILNSAKK